MQPVILCLNAGSTSLKFAVHEASRPWTRLHRGNAERIGGAYRLRVFEQELEVAKPADAPAAIRDVLAQYRPDWAIRLVAHRIVHGGPRHAGPALLDDVVLGELASLAPLAPLHQLAGVETARGTLAALPDAHHVACFDTAFHSTLPDLARTLPLPRELRDKGYRRYGFHGLSFEHVSTVLAAERPDLRRVVAAHLGGGSSLCAILDGRSIATTMGLTPLDGLPMTTRSGALDPGAVLALVRERGADVAEDLLYHASGLAGLSGLSGDMRELRAAGTPAASFAIDFFVERVAEAVAALTVPLGGMDALFFTGGIGANDPALRAVVAGRLAHLQPFELLHREADEESVMARQAATVLASPGG